MRNRKRPGCTHIEVMAYEVAWYEKHGKYPDRIKTDELGHRYVQVDLWWNHHNHYRREFVRKELAEHVAFRVTGIKI